MNHYKTNFDFITKKLNECKTADSSDSNLRQSQKPVSSFLYTSVLPSEPLNYILEKVVEL